MRNPAAASCVARTTAGCVWARGRARTAAPPTAHLPAAAQSVRTAGPAPSVPTAPAPSPAHRARRRARRTRQSAALARRQRRRLPLQVAGLAHGWSWQATRGWTCSCAWQASIPPPPRCGLTSTPPGRRLGMCWIVRQRPSVRATPSCCCPPPAMQQQQPRRHRRQRRWQRWRRRWRCRRPVLPSFMSAPAPLTTPCVPQHELSSPRDGPNGGTCNAL